MYKTIWTFATARFRITLDVAPEDMDPADSFELEEDIEVARSGDLHDWFQARVMVYLDGREVGSEAASFTAFVCGARQSTSAASWLIEEA